MGDYRYVHTCLGTPDDPSYLVSIHFGEDHCRLSSVQSISKVPNGRQILILEIIPRILLFGLPDMYRARFKSLWVDHVVDTPRWRKHISGTVEDLKQMRSWVGLNFQCCGIFADHFSKTLTLLM